MLILGILENAPCIPEIKIVEFLAYGIHSRGLGICIPRYNRAIREQIGIHSSPVECTLIAWDLVFLDITEQLENR